MSNFLIEYLNFIVVFLWSGTAVFSIMLAFDFYFGGANSDLPVVEQILWYLQRSLLVLVLFISAFSAQQVLTLLTH